MKNKISTHIALCSDIPQLSDNKIFDERIGESCIGTGWARHLRKHWIAGEVVTGDVAERCISDGEWMPSQVLVVQSDGSKVGERLEAYGCKKLARLNYESPLYAFREFDKRRDRVEEYAYTQQALTGPHREHVEGEARSMRMPCLKGSQKEWMRKSTLWNATGDRKNRVALIAGYKPLRSELRRCVSEGELRSLHYGALTDIRRLSSKTFRDARKLSTHTERIELIRQTANACGIDVYGRNWENACIHPAMIMGRCVSKERILRQYKYSLTLENCVWPGYHTEKLAQAIAEGTVPITRLDAVTAREVPRECFIDSREFAQGSCNLPTAKEYEKLVEAGKRYLASSLARLYFEEDFAVEMVEAAELARRR